MAGRASFRRWVRALGRETVERTRVRRAVRRGIGHNPVLVYQMGKVGSSTVVSTLERMDRTLPIFHFHVLRPEQIANAVRKQRRSIDPGLPEHLLTSIALRQALGTAPLRARVVTLTREPWVRLLSHLFEDRAKKMPEAIGPDGRIDVDQARRALDRLLERDVKGHIDPALWFDREIRRHLGIDVFEYPYDLARGFTIIPNADTPVLVIRMEDLNRSLPAALGRFLGVDPASVRIQRANEGAEKPYAEALAAAKSEFLPDRPLAERMAATRYFRHFYAADPPGWYRAILG